MAIGRVTVVVAAGAGALVIGGCQTDPEPLPATQTRSLKDYSRQLPPGRSALRLIRDPARLPDLGAAWDGRDSILLEAVERSIEWFDKPSTKNYFPFDGITHEQAQASCRAMLQLLESSPNRQAFLADLERVFDVYESIGCDDQGTVLFTGYYSPIFMASRVRTPEFTAPLYMRPDDLMTDPKTGQPLGRRTRDGQTLPYPTRREIESTNMFRGNELVWLEDSLASYIIHVNGSAKLRMTDGDTMYVGYAGKTDRPYASLGRAMIETGLIPEGGASLKAIRDVYRQKPRDVEDLMYRNESYVFFQEYAADNWPAGSLGFQVAAERSLATDKAVYPRGGVVLVDTLTNTFSRGNQSFVQFMLDQDTGGAIKAPGRGDLFMGVGPMAEILAGGQYAEGKLYYFFLKPEYVDQY